ncbi:MAG TPA: 50S ribosomal protein L25, partial [Salmonella bongori]|nr:50S ribosomal protein L25 [Salmonella bongori]
MSIESRPLLHTQSRSLTCCWVAC